MSLESEERPIVATPAVTVEKLQAWRYREPHPLKQSLRKPDGSIDLITLFQTWDRELGELLSILEQSSIQGPIGAKINDLRSQIERDLQLGEPINWETLLEKLEEE